MKMTRTFFSTLLAGCFAGMSAAAYARLIPHWGDGSPFGAALAAALVAVGLAAGALAGAAIQRRGRAFGPACRSPVDQARDKDSLSEAWTGLVLFAGVAWLALTPFLLPHALENGLQAFGGHLPAFGRFLRWQSGMLGGALLPPALLTGCMWMRMRRSASLTAAGPRGLADAAMAGAALVGALATGRLLIPSWGLETTLRLAVWVGALAVSLALGAALAGRPRRVAVAAIGLPLLLAAGFWPAFRDREPLLAEQPIACWLATQGAQVRLPGRVAAHADGQGHALTVRQLPDGTRLLCRDGVRRYAQPGDRPAAVLAVQIPLLLHPDPRRLALAGLDGGDDLAAATDHPLTVIAGAGLEPGQVPLFRRLLADGHNREETLDDPRVALDAASPRRMLRREPGRYDVIVSVPAPPWQVAGARALSRKAFAEGLQALATNGIHAVSVDVQSLGPRQLSRIIADFAAVFPNSQVWSPQFNRYLLIGTAGESTFDAERLLARLEHRPVMRALSQVGVRALPDLLACLVLTPAGVRRYLAEQANADRGGGNGLVWQAARNRLTPKTSLEALAGVEAARAWRLDTLRRGNLEPELFEALQARAVRQMAARAAFMEMRVSIGQAARDEAMRQAQAAARLNPEDAFLDRLLASMEQEAAQALARRDYPGAARSYGVVLGLVPDRVSARYGAAMADRGLGRLDRAYQHLVRAVAVAPTERACRIALAEVAFELKKGEEALRHYAWILERQPDEPDALAGLAVCLSRSDPPLRDVPRAITAAERAAELTRYRDPRIARILADLYVENGRVVEGVSLKRRMRMGAP